jgi:tetratricopeptide (TPR) repeat protein
MAATADSGVLKDAQKRLQALIQDAPDDPDALHALALTELKLGQPEDAMAHLARAAAAAPQGLLIAVTMAQAKVQQRDPKGAEEVLKKVVDNSPESADAHLALADFYLVQRRMPDAEAHLKRGLEVDPKSGAALMTLARLQLTEGRKQEAEQNFKQLSSFGGYESIYAIFLSQDGRRDEAVREFEKLAKAHPQDRRMRTNLLAAYQGSNRLSDAKRILADVLKKNPNDLDALLQRGELLTGSGEYTQAEADLNHVLRLKPDSPEVHYIVAKLNRARGKTLIYRQELSQALKLNQYLLPVRLESAQELIASNNGKAALDLLDQAPEFQRTSMDVLVTRNWALWALGDMPGMRKGIDRGLAQGRSPDILLQDGIWKMLSGQPTAARAALEAVLNIDSTDVRALAALRQTYTSIEAATALQRVREYAARQPKSAPVQEFLGLLLVANRDNAGARRAFEAAKAADPQFVKSDLSLVQVDAMERKLDDGRSRLKTLISGGNDSPTVRLWLGNLEEAKGNHSAAIEEFRKVVEANPGNAQALNNLAYLLAEYGKQPDEALKYAEKAVELAPESGAYCDTLGWILYQKGLYANALKFLERATAAKTNPVWKYHLAMAYAQAGQVTRSKATLEAALKLNPNLPEARTAQELVRKAQ